MRSNGSVRYPEASSSTFLNFKRASLYDWRLQPRFIPTSISWSCLLGLKVVVTGFIGVSRSGLTSNGAGGGSTTSFTA